MGFTLLQLTDSLSIAFKVDGISILFAALTTVMWILVGIYSLEYMRHEEHKSRYAFFYCLVYAVLLGLDFSANLITFYVFYELMTLTSVPLILHELNPESIAAGFKYLYYSITGAFLALFGIFVLSQYTTTLDFIPGGTLNLTAVTSHYELLLAAAVCVMIGFGAKAGMFPLHAWLPVAHPVAPAPASAVLSGVITKSGVLGMIRVVFYIFGAEFLRGTWVQYAWMVLALMTVLMGSMRAYQEKVLKKRLAYSTVSQVSYILFGLATLTPLGMVGALMHIVFHSIAKDLLFLGAGAIIHQTGKTRVDELKGIGKQMPVTIWCFTLAGLSLIGIPPLSGFLSKWYLAQGALSSGISGFSWIGPVILLISALLTAGYLLPVTIDGFLPGKEYDSLKLPGCEAGLAMLAPMVILAVLALILGIFPASLISIFGQIAESVM